MNRGRIQLNDKKLVELKAPQYDSATDSLKLEITSAADGTTKWTFWDFTTILLDIK